MVIKPLDLFIIFITVILIALYVVLILPTNKSNSFVHVEVEGEKYIYDLNTDREFKIRGPLGDSTINIEKSKVSIISSPCKNKTCIHIGEINKSNQSTACLPNRLIITIEGEVDEVDTISF